MSKRICTGDIEADGLLDTATVVWCGVFVDHDTGEVHEFYPGSHDDYIKAMLEFLDTVPVLCMHNGIAYDWPLLRRLYDYEFKGTKVDTLLMSRLQRPNRQLPPQCPNKKAGPHSVEAWAYRLGSVRKVEHEDWSQFSQEMLNRCRTDVLIQQKIYDALIEEGQGQNWEEARKLTFKLFENLQRQEEYGWPVNVEYMHHCIATLDRWIARIDRAVGPFLPLLTENLETKKDGEYSYVKKPFLKSGKLADRVLDYWGDGHSNIAGPYSRVAFRRVDLDSNSEVKEFLLSLGWEPTEWNTNDAGERTSPKLSKDDNFEGIQGSLGRLVAKRIQCRQRRGIIEGWLEVVRPDGRMPSVVSGIASTGRAKHKNVVNVPRATSFFGKWMRRIFIAREGWVLVGTDSEGNQLRQLAARMGDPAYIEAVCNGTSKDGTDPHSLVRDLCGLASRDVAKTLQYGVIFGAGDKKAGKIVGGNAAEGKRLKALLFDRLPGLKNAVDKLADEWKKNARQVYNRKYGRMEYKDGWFTGLDGRPIYCESEHALLVYALQSDEAIQMAAAYNYFHKLMDKEGYVWGKDYGVVCWYHDEFTVECRPDIANRVGELAAYSIEWAGRYYRIGCPHKGKAQIGLNWAEIH